MKIKHTPPLPKYRTGTLCVLLLSITTCISSVSAQEPDESEVFELSPFVISADDQGYLATQTLAGTRLRTNIADTPVSLSILTEDLLDDIAATNVDTMAEYLPSTESFTLLGSDVSGNESKAGDVISVRGFRTNSRSRNFFTTMGSTDRYLTERITAARGPNSLLYGIGNPGGILLMDTNRARFGNNFGELEYQYDSTRNGGHRFTFDQNYEMIKNKLAVRASALTEDVEGFRNPEYRKRDGLYLTGTYVPFKSGKTRMRFNYEYEATNQVRARPWAPYDFYSYWLDNGAPLYNNLGARAGGSPTASNPYIRMENNFINIVDQDAINAFYAQRVNNVYNSYVRSSGPIANGSEYKDRSITSDFVAVNPMDTLSAHFGDGLEAWLAGLGDLRSIPESYIGQTLTIPMETWFSGNLDDYNKDFDAFSAFLEQQIGDNLTIEIAGNWETMDDDGVAIMRSSDYGITYDPNLYLPDGSPNPYAGFPYLGVFNFATKDVHAITTEEYRMTATYDLDLSEKKFLKYFDLGRHQFSALLNRYIRDNLTTQERPAITGWNGVGIADLNNQGIRWGGARVRGRYYLLPGSDGFVPEPWIPLKGEGIVGTSAWTDFNFSSEETTIDSMAFSTQSFFFNNRLVLTAGIRKDKMDIDQAVIINYTKETDDPENGKYLNEPDIEATLNNRVQLESREWDNESYGAVYHLIRDKGFINQLSVFYNYSTNNSGENIRRDINFDEVDPLSGEGTDIGIKFALFDNKLVGTFTSYETSQVNNFINDLGPYARGGIVSGQAGVDNNIDAILEIVDPEELAYRNSFTSASQRAWVPVFDSVSEGYELELVWNVSSQFRLRATYSTIENVPTGLGEDIVAWYAARRPDWVAYAEQNPGTPEADIINAAIEELDFDIPFKLTYNEVPSLGVPDYRASLLASYRFANDTFLKGFSIGASYRYRSSAIVAFERDENGVANTANLLKTSPEKNFDVSVTYRRKIFNGKYDWRIQLNVRNVLDDTDPIYLDGIWDVDTSQFVLSRNKMVAPRAFIITTSIGW